jgi:integrase
MQRKTGQPVRFEVNGQTRDAVQAWIAERKLCAADYLFPSRIRASRHLSTRQYARIVRGWASLIGLDPGEYGIHSLRRTKATLIYLRTKNLPSVQLLLGHPKIESTVSTQEVEVDDTLEIAEHQEI